MNDNEYHIALAAELKARARLMRALADLVSGVGPLIKEIITEAVKEAKK